MIDTLNLTVCVHSDYTLHVLAHTCVNISAIVGGWADGGQLENFNILPNPITDCPLLDKLHNNTILNY